jgi:hypothetical protein
VVFFFLKKKKRKGKKGIRLEKVIKVIKKIMRNVGCRREKEEFK